MLRGVGDDRGVVEPLSVEARAQRGDLSVHHRARSHDVSSCLGVGDRRAGQQWQGRVVVDSIAGDDAAVAMTCVFAQAHVGGKHERELRSLELAERFRHRSAVVRSAFAARVLHVGYPEKQDAAHTERGQALSLDDGEVGAQTGMALEGRDLLAARPA